MIITLPSHGKMRISAVDMRQPKINDLRKVADLGQSEELAKTDFVSLLLKNPEDINKMSIFDRDYLFLISVGIINMNQIEFDYTCACGSINKDVFDISEQEVTVLNSDPFAEKTIDKVVYKYHLLTVEEESAAAKVALGTDADYQETMQDLLVGATLGFDIDYETVEKVSKLDTTVYYSALFFMQCMFHGVENVKLCTCKNCSKETMVIIPLVKNLLSIDTSTIMGKFAELSKAMDFKSFVDLTIPELTAMIKRG